MDHLAHIGARVFEVLFLLGMVGSVGVVTVSVIEDIRGAFADDEEEHA